MNKGLFSFKHGDSPVFIKWNWKSTTMKYIWESSDVVMGRRVTSYNGAENYIISWCTVGVRISNTLHLVSGRDGMVIGPFTIEQITHHLNENEFMPQSIDPNKRTPLNP